MRKIEKIMAPLFREIPSTFLGVLRILTSLIAISMTIMLYLDVVNIFGSKSYFNHEITSIFSSPFSPKAHWVTDLLQTYSGLGEIEALKTCLIIYILSLIGLLFGFYTRITAGIALFFCAMLTGTAEPMVYGVDYFIMAALFYCFIFPSGNALTFKHLTHKQTPIFVNVHVPFVFLLTLQVHLAMIYCFNGIAKSFGETWWSGEAVWRATMLLDSRNFELGFMANYPWVFKISSRIVLSFELLYPILILFRFTRLPTILVIIGMHLFIAIFMKLYFFAAIMIALNVAAFWFELSPFFSSIFNKSKIFSRIKVENPVNVFS